MNKYIFLFLIYIFSILNGDPFKPLNIDFLKENSTVFKSKKTPVNTKKSNKKLLPPYLDFVKDVKKIDGLFTMYWNHSTGQVLMEIKPEHFEMIFLSNMTRTSGDALYYDGGSMLWEYPFIINRLNNELQLVEINTLFRADSSKAIHKLVDRNFSNSIITTAKILSEPHKESGAFLVDANDLFIKDLAYVSQHRKGQYLFDKKNSYFVHVASYENNTELDIATHFKSRKWTNAYTLPNSHSMMHQYHISLSLLEDSGTFISRVADDRIGYFTTIFQDYTNTLQETQYVRYINKWNLRKKDNSNNKDNVSLPTVPGNLNTVLVEPQEPIVYWIENTVPEEFRAAIKEGVLAWNQAFERIGYKNAIVAKQMPDDASWNPGDVRYNTIRWIIQPGSGYAVGPSRANPFTGEIYDADIRISADFVRAFYREYDEFVFPVIGSEDPIAFWEQEEKENSQIQTCQYANHLKNQMIFSWQALLSQGLIDNTESAMKKYIHDGLVDLVLHEVGHTLGLRHNFKASSIYSVEQLSNPEFTEQFGISGSVMDYHAVCLLDNGHTLFQTQPGLYDLWAIEYGYSDESTNLESIANQSNNPYLAYGTDEDAFGLSSRGIDPLCNTWDMSSDPIEYYRRQLSGVENLWNNILLNFEKKGKRYQKLRSVFSQGVGEYRAAARTVSKFVGGINFSRHHIGDPGDKNPFIVVNPDKQREALHFLINRIFSKDAFEFDSNVLNKLSPERFEDFRGHVWRMDRLDYPLHKIIQSIHSTGLYSLFHPRRMARLQDNELRYVNENKFTMAELFSEINTAIWIELDSQENIDSFRRNLQNIYIELFRVMILNENANFPNDSKLLARSSLKNILQKIYFNLSNANLDTYTQSHLENSAKDIELILEAQLTVY
tara:strand:- start:8012 stop:10681 length:2670 start_codon:yes stop_codon:yes gene_type:complete